MTRRTRFLLVGLAGWQFFSFVALTVAFWKDVFQVSYPDLGTVGDQVESLINPSLKELQLGAAEVDRIRPESSAENPDMGQFDEFARRLRRDEFNEVRYRDVPGDGLPPNAGLMGWRVWTESGDRLDRARAAVVIAATEEDETRSFLSLKAALQHFMYGSTFPLERRASILGRLAELAHNREERMLAFALWQRAEMDLGVRAPSERWGPAVFNQGVALQEAGFHAVAELVFLRLLASHVNDEDPGSSLMTPVRNYRNRAASLIAGSYADRGLYPHAILWYYPALNEFEFKSWCGTCHANAESWIRTRIIENASFAGPLFLAAVFAYEPLNYRLHWALGIWGLLQLWRFRTRRRQRRRAESAGAANRVDCL